MSEAIKLVIEKGGWNFPVKHWFYYQHSASKVGDASYGIERGVCVSQEEAYPVISSDRLFWQALGRALGWEETEKYLADYESGVGDFLIPIWGEQPVWKKYALRFFELKLTGGDEEKFWQQLIPQR